VTTHVIWLYVDLPAVCLPGLHAPFAIFVSLGRPHVTVRVIWVYVFSLTALSLRDPLLYRRAEPLHAVHELDGPD
jgi:hypothetical protein